MINKLFLYILTGAAIMQFAPESQAEEHAKYLGSIWQGTESAIDRAQSPLLGPFFNQVTPENCGKWGCVERERGTRVWENWEAMLKYADEHDLLVKYHGFVWGMQQPKWTETAPDMKAAVNDWMDEFFSRYGDKVGLIDVLNEPITQPAGYRDQLGGDGETGWDWVVWVFRRAHYYADKYDCQAQFILNEWGILKNDAKMKRFRDIVEILQKENLIDAIGAQGHFLEQTSAADVKRRLDYLAETGLPIHISEFELDIRDDRVHAGRFAELFPVFWEHPAVRGVTLWGHREGTMWRPNGYLVYSDGSDRPAMTWLREYLKNSKNTDK